MERILGLEHPNTLTSRSILADVYANLGDYAKAKELFAQVLEARERVLGPEHPDTLTSRNNLAGVYYRLGDYAEARKLFAQVLEARERVLGPEHPDTLTSRHNLAGVYDDLGDYAKARELYTQVLEARERILGLEHPDTLNSRNNLASVYVNLGDYAKAKKLLAQVLEAEERILGAEHPDTLTFRNNLAGVYLRLGDNATAGKLYAQTLEAQERILGPEHPYTLTSRNNLALFYDNLGDYAKARELYTQVLEARERILGPEHPDTLTSRNNLAYVYGELGDYAKARELYTQVLEAGERILGPEHPNTATIIANLSQTLFRTGDRTGAIFYAKLAVEAGQQQRRSQRGLEKDLQQTYLRTIENRYHFLARLLIEDGRPEEAQEVLRLLKESELSELFRAEARSETGNAPGIFFGPEKELRAEFLRLAESMRTPYTKQAALREKEKQAPLAKAEEEELRVLQTSIAAATQDFRTFCAGLPAKLGESRAGILADPYRLRNVKELRSLMSRLGQGTAVIHTLSAEDTLYLFLTTRDVFKVYPVDVKRIDLEKQAAAFSLYLTSPRLDPRPAAQAMHKLILAPLADDLRAAGAETLMLSLDGALRYVPMAALHDGEKWLVETYNLTMFTEAARDRLTAEFPTEVRVAALRLTEAKGDFPPLPAVKGELESIVRENRGEKGVLPGFRRLNADFNYQSLSAAMRAATPVLHIAGHFQFEPVAPDQSFLVLGDGGKVTLFHFNPIRGCPSRA
jgi:CHAT domain-containing protein/Tfp pilus assembly protein PilF